MFFILPPSIYTDEVVINDEEATATAAAAADGFDRFDGIEEVPTGGEENKSGDGDAPESTEEKTVENNQINDDNEDN